MKIRNGKDFWAGLMFIAFGVGFFIVSRQYSMGTAVRMGPSYFPSVLAGILIVLGALVFLRAFLSKIEHSIAVFPFRWLLFLAGAILGGIMFASSGWWAGMGKPAVLLQYTLNAAAIFLMVGAFGPRSLYILLVAVICFGYLLKPLGLVLASGILIVVSAWGGHEFKLREALISFVVLAIFSVGTFIYGLGLPFNIWPDLG